MKNIAYKYQNYNSKYVFADAIITQYANSMTAIKNKRNDKTDIVFCQAFESAVKNLFETYARKRILWMYILCNEYPHKAKSYTRKELDLIDVGFPVSRPSYYREVILLTNLVAECFGLGKEYVKTKKEIHTESVPSSSDIISYVIDFNAA